MFQYQKWQSCRFRAWVYSLPIGGLPDTCVHGLSKYEKKEKWRLATSKPNLGSSQIALDNISNNLYVSLGLLSRNSHSFQFLSVLQCIKHFYLRLRDKKGMQSCQVILKGFKGS